MPSSNPATVPVTCPRCGHVQREPKAAYSTVCRRCHEHFRVQEALEPEVKVPRLNRDKPALARTTVQCFQCGTELEVPVAAESTMCKRCSGHVDLRDYTITQATSRNFRTHGRLVIEPKGYLFNTDSVVGEAVIKGKFIGKLVAQRALEIHSTADIKGNLSAARLIVPAGNHFRWREALRVGAAEISGELVGNVQTMGTVLLKSTARFFGNVEARHLVVENGAVFVGAARIGSA